MSNIGQNMMLITSSFRNVKSFNLIPVNESCPYVEGMYDPSSGILAIITKVMKNSFHMLPKLDDNGQPQKLKFPNQETGKVHKEQRVSVETFSEFYVMEKDEMENFINMFAVNADSFDYKKYMAT